LVRRGGASAVAGANRLDGRSPTLGSRDHWIMLL
jgi:hypothetical protein